MSRRTRLATDIVIEQRLQRRRRRADWQAAEQRHAEGRVPSLAVVRPIARTSLRPGTVVWAHVTFEENEGYKLRPVVVSHLSGRDVTVYPGTTSDRRYRYRRGYRELVDLESAGLPRATGIELSAITIDVIDVASVAGILGVEDRLAIVDRVGHLTVPGTGLDCDDELAVAV